MEGVTKAFGVVQALRGVDLRVEQGSFLTLFGPNGAGKTTLIRILATLTKPTSGSAQVGGYDLARQPERVRAVTGVISHDPYLYGSLTALENIRFFASMYNVPRPEERAREVIKRMGLEARMHDVVRTFSRGMQQRLSVARAIVHDPGILLLDEPYTGLDQHGAALLTEMLRGIKQERRTVVMTTHNVGEGLELSDRVMIIDGGRITYSEDSASMEPGLFKDRYMKIVGI